MKLEEHSDYNGIVRLPLWCIATVLPFFDVNAPISLAHSRASQERGGAIYVLHRWLPFFTCRPEISSTVYLNLLISKLNMYYYILVSDPSTTCG